MASQNGQEDKTLEKAIWGTIGTGVLWVSLLLSGLAFERLGLTSFILPGVLPGEVGSLRAELEDCKTNLGQISLERDVLKRTEDTLRTRIKELQR
jgi:hypothetical protein